jgi:hypothetical protein
MVTRLEISRKDGLKLAVFDRTANGAITLAQAHERMRTGFEHWLANGLLEIVGEPGEKRTRLTLSSEPEFLSRVATYLHAQGFVARFVSISRQPGHTTETIHIRPPRKTVGGSRAAATWEERRANA